MSELRRSSCSGISSTSSSRCSSRLSTASSASRLSIEISIRLFTSPRLSLDWAIWLANCSACANSRRSVTFSSDAVELPLERTASLISEREDVKLALATRTWLSISSNWLAAADGSLKSTVDSPADDGDGAAERVVAKLCDWVAELAPGVRTALTEIACPIVPSSAWSESKSACAVLIISAAD